MNKKATAESSHKSRTGAKTVESKPKIVPKMKTTADVKQGRTARKENVAKRQRAAAKTKDTAEFGQKITARGKTVAGKQKTIAKKVHVGRRKVVATNTGKAAANDKTTTRNRKAHLGRGKETATKTGKVAANDNTTTRNRNSNVGRGKKPATKTGKVAANAKTTARHRNSNVGRGKETATKTGKAAAHAKTTTARNRNVGVGRGKLTTTTGKAAANAKSTARNRNSNVGRGNMTATKTGKSAANTKKTTARNRSAHVVRGKATATKAENGNDVCKIKPTVMTNESAGIAKKKKQNAEFSISDLKSDKEYGVLQPMIRLLDCKENLEKNQTAQNAEKGTASVFNSESDEDYTVETDTSRVSDFDPSGFSDSYHFDFDQEEPMVTDEPSRFPHSNQERKQTTQKVEKGTASFNTFDSYEEEPMVPKPIRFSDSNQETKQKTQKAEEGPFNFYDFDGDEEEPMVPKPISFSDSNQETKQTTQKIEKGTASVNHFDWDEDEPMVAKPISFSDSNQETKQTTQKAGKGPFNVYDLDSDEVEIMTIKCKQYKRVFKSYTKKRELTQKRTDKPTIVFDSDIEGESIAEEKLSNSVSADETMRTFEKRIIHAPLSIGDDNKVQEPRYNFFDSDSEEEKPAKTRANEPSNVVDSDSEKQESEPNWTVEPSNVLDTDSDVEFIAEEKVEVIDVLDSDSEPEVIVRNDANIPRQDLSDAEIAQYKLLQAYDFSLSSKAMAERAARKQAAKERRMEDGVMKRKRKRGHKTTPSAKKRKCSESQYVLPVKTPEIRDLFLSLPWSHVIWQHVLPFLRVVDKFRLRAVNTHCKGVVERDFSMALSILPPPRPQMNRVAWRVLAGGNRSAIRLTAPVFRREAIYDPFSLVDLDLLYKKRALRYLSLSYTRVYPSYGMLKKIAKQFPDLEELHLQGIQNVFCLMNAELRSLTEREMTRLHTLDLSRNSHEITLSTLRELVETQKSLRVLAIDAKPIADERVGVLQELADLWLYSDLQRLTLTRTPPKDSKCGLRHCRCAPNCRCIPGPLYPCTLTMADAIFIKTTDPDGRIVKKFLYTDCFSLGELGVDWGRYIPEDELKDQGVEVRSHPCTFLNHLYQELLLEPNTVYPQRE